MTVTEHLGKRIKIKGATASNHKILANQRWCESQSICECYTWIYLCVDLFKPLKAYCCHMGTAI